MLTILSFDLLGVRFMLLCIETQILEVAFHDNGIVSICFALAIQSQEYCNVVHLKAI
jgi:hypothetical protein